MQKAIGKRRFGQVISFILAVVLILSFTPFNMQAGNIGPEIIWTVHNATGEVGGYVDVRMELTQNTVLGKGVSHLVLQFDDSVIAHPRLSPRVDRDNSLTPAEQANYDWFRSMGWDDAQVWGIFQHAQGGNHALHNFSVFSVRYGNGWGNDQVSIMWMPVNIALGSWDSGMFIDIRFDVVATSPAVTPVTFYSGSIATVEGGIANFNLASQIPGTVTILQTGDCQCCICDEWEWVQVWAAGAYDYERNYHKLYLIQREYGVHRPYNVARLWVRSNPSNSFGPPSAPNNVAFGDDEFTGIGLFVDGISFRFGHGPGDYRNIYRQPNRDIPDLTITEVTWNWRWHYEAVRVYLYNVELYDGTMLDRYFLGEVFNKVYDDRNPDNPKGGYIEDGFFYEFRVDGNFIHTDIWFPPHIFRASSLRLVDFTDSIHNWSTARNGCPIENTGPNPHRTYTRYCDGFDVDAMSTWYRRPVNCTCGC